MVDKNIIQELNEREQLILSTIVKDYILSAEPVGSRSLSKNPQIKLSPASIRNVMSDLEEKGFLGQPHTSAGRIPSDKGYRFFVDGIRDFAELTQQEKETIRMSIAEQSDVESILEVTCGALGKVTKQLGVTLSPRFVEGTFKKIDFIGLSEHRILLVLELESGIVKTMTVEVDIKLSHDILSSVCTILNQKFTGKTVSDIQKNLNISVSNINIGEKELGAIKLFIPSVEQLFESANQSSVHASGVPIMLSQPEFFDKSMMSAVMEILENKMVLLHLFNNREKKNGIYISIGGENENGQFKSFSIVSSAYKIGNMTGTIGVIGPTRMPYPKLISAVDYTVKALEEKQKGML